MSALSLLAAIPLIACVLVLLPLTAQTVPVAPFNSVELRNGGKVILRHGPTPQITFLKGSQEYSSVLNDGGGVLVIDECKSHCPKGYVLELEIVTPNINRISVSEGGTIETRGSFPPQAEVIATVRHGGTIDIRSINSERVSASVYEGGRILTNPRASMVASVANGGQITYWTNAYVQSSVQSGGRVTKGDAAEADKPLSELRSSVTPPPAVPPLPPVPPVPPVISYLNR